MMVVKQSPSRESGTMLILVLILSLIVTMTLAGAVMTTMVMGRSAQYELDQTKSLSAAEGVTEFVQKQMLDSVANFNQFPLNGSVTLGSESYGYNVSPIGAPMTRVDPDGVSTVSQTYLISSTVNEGSGSATVNRVIDLSSTPIFQFMIFYDDDLEILPGPEMFIEGRVHCNADIYVGTGASLTVDTDYFRSTGEILRQRKNDGSTTGGNVDVKVYGQSTFHDFPPSEDSSNPDWINLALDNWQGTVQSGAHGVKEIAAPDIGSIKAFDPDTGAKGYYHEQADLVIVDNVAYVNDSPVALPPGTVSEKTMYDAREGKDVTVTEIDIGLLNTSGQFPTNGLIYAYRTDASQSQPNGIRLSNAAELADNLTVVTEDPVYVKGDYNTINKKGSAVISDAVNLLSNAWTDMKSPGNLPTATETTYNLAMVTGIVPTPDGGGNYSGGFENLPRFHERWTGVSAIIRGAFVNIYDSEIGTGNWQYGGDVYTAPKRDWRFDPDLLDGTFLPPFSPNAVYVSRVLWDDNVPNPF